MRESRIERALREGVEALGGECYKFTSPGRRGVPDRIVYLPHPQAEGTFVRVHVETKAPGRGLKPWQERERARLQRLGERVVKLDSLEAVAHFLGRPL